MERFQKLKVNIHYTKGDADCVCSHARDCTKQNECVKEKVLRDRYEGWKQTMHRSRYGK